MRVKGIRKGSDKKVLIEVPQKVAKIVVVKRDGKKVEFNGAKIALAIQKGFEDIISMEDKAYTKYNETDVNKVYSKVLGRIEKLENEKIKIEEIQDLIEEELKNNGYKDVYEAFSNYREKRAQSRRLFFDEKKQHKFLKALENLGLKSAGNEETKSTTVQQDTAMGTMIQYGTTISKQFAMTYLMKKKFTQAHENGDIYIHDLDYVPTGTTTCCQIDINKLYEDGFGAGESSLREPKDIMSYTALATIAFQSVQNDQHGGQSIPAFDYYMAPGVLKTFKKQLKQLVFDYLELMDFDKFIATNGIEREIEKISTINIPDTTFDKYCRDSSELKRMFRISNKKALQKTQYITYQAMEAFIHNINAIYSKTELKLPAFSVSFGTDISPEGKMVSKNLLKVLEVGIGNCKEAVFPIAIFKVKQGINFKEKDPNYDLFKLACQVSSKRNYPNFSFLDASFNTKFYQENNYDTEVSYMRGCIRVMENIVDPNKAVTAGRGNLSFTTINLPRLGIKHGAIANQKANIKEFLEELEEKLDLVKDQLLERYELQCKKKVDSFPFLLGQKLWIDSEKLKSGDTLKKVLKQGSLSIGFIGLAQCLKALTGKHHGEDEAAQKLGIKIVKFMKQKCDEYSQKYNLNFNLVASPVDEIEGKFIKMDQAIFGKLKGITDKESYTNSFHIPNDYKISIVNKIQLEAPYHSYTNGGHITCVEEKGISEKEVMEIVKLMQENNIGYGAIKNDNLK